MFVPWMGVYAVFFGDPASGKFSGTVPGAAALLLVPASLAAAAGAVVYRSFWAKTSR